MPERAPLPNPPGMDRNSPEYRAAVRAAVAGAPPLNAVARTTLRRILAEVPAAPVRPEPTESAA